MADTRISMPLQERVQMLPAKSADHHILLCSLMGVCAALSATVLFSSGHARAQEIDMKAMMPCGIPDSGGRQSVDVCERARELFIQQCTSCHSFVPIVRQQKVGADWDGTLRRHTERLSEAPSEDLELIGQFLKDHFNPDRPVPSLPQELIDNDPGFPPA